MTRALQSRTGAAVAAPHRIQHLEFQLRFHPALASYSGETALAGLVQDELLREVERALDELDTGQRLLRLGRVDVELGVVRHAGSWSELRRRLREALRLALRRAGVSTVAPAPAAVPVADASVLYFLRHGVLPPQTRIRDQGLLGEQLLVLARDCPQSLMQLLGDRDQGSVAGTRLLRQFPRLDRVALLRNLGLEGAEALGEVIRGLTDMVDRAQPPQSSGNIEEILWQVTLQRWAGTPTSAATDLQQTLIGIVAQALGWPVQRVRKHLADGQSGPSPAVPAAALGTHAPLAGTDDDDKVSGQGFAGPWGDLRLSLEQDQPIAAPSLLAALRARELDSELLSAELSTTALDRLVRHLIGVTATDAAAAARLVQAIETRSDAVDDRGGFLRSVLQAVVQNRPIVLEAVQPSRPAGSPEPWSGLGARLERDQDVAAPALLTALRSGELDGETLCAGLSVTALGRLGSHLVGVTASDAAAAARLVQAIEARTDAADDPAGLLRSVVQALVQNRPIVLETASPSRPVASPEPWSGLGARLERDQAVAAPALLMALRSGEVNGEALCAGLSVTALNRLVSHLVGVTASDAVAGARLVQAVEARTDALDDRAGFLRSVVQALVQNRPIVLEAASPSRPATSPASGSGLSTHLKRDQAVPASALLMALRSGELESEALCAAVSAAALHQLVAALLDGTGLDPPTLRWLREKLRAQVAETGDPPRLYRRIVAALVEGNPVDLDLLASLVADVPSMPHRPGSPQPGASATGSGATTGRRVGTADATAGHRHQPFGAETEADPFRGEAAGSKSSTAGLEASDRLASLRWLLEEMADEDRPPAILQRYLARCLEAAPDAVRALLAAQGSEGLTLPALRGLVAGLIAVRSAANPLAVQLGVVGQARRVADETGYCRRVATWLLDGQRVDRYPSAPTEAPNGPVHGEAELFAFLASGACALGEAELLKVFEQGLQAAPRRLRQGLNRIAGDERALERLFDLLPEELRGRLLQRLLRRYQPRPEAYLALLAETAVASGAVQRRAAVERWLWRYAYSELLGAKTTGDLGPLLAGAVAALAGVLPEAKRLAFRNDLLQRLTARGADPVAADLLALLTATRPSTATGPEFTVPMDADAPLSRIRVANAGVVLAAPFLPRLFDRLGWLADGSFRDPALRERAVHLLQYLVDGQAETPEYELALNKLLSGLDLAVPIARGIMLESKEEAQAEALLAGMVGHWRALGQCSIAGLRETFLQREGTLHRMPDGWRLQVESRAFDMLLDRLPWSYRTLRHPWMREVIHVDWR